MPQRAHFAFLISFLCSPLLIAQVLVSGNPSFSPQEYITETLDKSHQNIYYEYTYARDPEKKENTKSSLTVLQIGKNFSKFIDYNSIRLDSVKQKHSQLKRIEKNEMNEQLSFMNLIGFKPSIIKDFNKSNFIFQSRIPSNTYEYIIDQPELNWNLEQEFKTVLGYKAQKATVIYSGRKWNAWFTEAIPIFLGPYIFGNLPGLIIELYDEERNFNFVANGHNMNEELIYKINEKNIIRTSQTKFLKTQKSYHERPSLFLRGSTEANEIKKIPYNPFELNDTE